MLIFAFKAFQLISDILDWYLSAKFTTALIFSLVNGTEQCFLRKNHVDCNKLSTASRHNKRDNILICFSFISLFVISKEN